MGVYVLKQIEILKDFGIIFMETVTHSMVEIIHT
jgi:hypothetical protein